MYKLILRNWSLKLFALALAAGLWAHVVGQETAEVGIRMPVQLTNLPKDLVVKGEVPNEVEIRLFGPSSLVLRTANEDRHKVLNLAGLGEGPHVFQVVTDDLRLPGSVRVIRVSPARLSVTLVPRKNKKLPVRPILKGKPALGFITGEVEFTPKEVMASGPGESLKDLDWIWTVPIDISGRKQDLSRKVALQLPTDHTLRLSPMEVQAKVSIKTVRAKAAKSGDAPSRVTHAKGAAQETTEVVKEAAKEAAKQAESTEPGNSKGPAEADTGGTGTPKQPAGAGAKEHRTPSADGVDQQSQ